VARAIRDSLESFADRLPEHCVELPEGLRRDRRKQGLAVGKMPVGRRLRDAEFFCQRLEVDGFRAALFGFSKGGLNQSIAKIPMVVGVDRLAG
jgi:hypothetical protein